jgi:hypothetical protein
MTTCDTASTNPDCFRRFSQLDRFFLWPNHGASSILAETEWTGMVEFVFLSKKNKERYLRIITPLRKVLTRLGVHPNILSIAGLILSVVAGFVYSTGSFFWAAWIVVLAGTCDALDGELARQTGKNSRFGAFFDSALDRYSDGFILMGLGWYFAGGGRTMGEWGRGIGRKPKPMGRGSHYSGHGRFLYGELYTGPG